MFGFPWNVDYWNWVSILFCNKFSLSTGLILNYCFIHSNQRNISNNSTILIKGKNYFLVFLNHFSINSLISSIEGLKELINSSNLLCPSFFTLPNCLMRSLKCSLLLVNMFPQVVSILMMIA